MLQCRGTGQLPNVSFKDPSGSVDRSEIHYESEDRALVL